MVAVLLGLAGCSPWILPTDASAAQATISLVGGVQADALDGANDDVQEFVLEGSLADGRDYALFHFGPGKAGDAWRVTAPSTARLPTGIRVALFDENLMLLSRSGTALDHVLRRDIDDVVFGVALSGDGRPQDFRLSATKTRAPAPQPSAKLVYLDFSGASKVVVQSRPPTSFAAFDAASLGTQYAGTTATVKAALIARIARHYAAYNIELISSDDVPPPSAPHSTIYIGGKADGWLGLADKVNEYNQVEDANAIVFAENFALYENMQLTPEEIGAMIGDVVAHELGHLLGLYHTATPECLMEGAGSVWDMIFGRELRTDALASSVFPVGQVDLPQILADTVGLRETPLEIADPVTRRRPGQ